MPPPVQASPWLLRRIQPGALNGLLHDADGWEDAKHGDRTSRQDFLPVHEHSEFPVAPRGELYGERWILTERRCHTGSLDRGQSVGATANGNPHDDLPVGNVRVTPKLT
jgi:hypothetical protein